MSMFIKEKTQQSTTTATATATHQVKVEEQLFPSNNNNNNSMVFEDEEKKQKKAGSSSSSGRKSGGGGGGGGGGWGGGIGVCCQADLCGVDLTESKRYHRRHKVCETHAKAPSVLISGLTQRFCQQCSRFHELTEFDEAKRSCRRRLAGHNERRRKASSLEPQKESGSGSGTSSSSRTKAATATATTTAANPQCRPADQMSTAHPASTTTPTNYKPYEIR